MNKVDSGADREKAVGRWVNEDRSSLLTGSPRSGRFFLLAGAGKTFTISNVDPNAIGMNTRCVAGACVRIKAVLDPGRNIYLKFCLVTGPC